MRCRRPSGFSLLELIVVVGIIALLLAILAPVLGHARAQARNVACRAQMRDVGVNLMIYANANDGWLFPLGRGTGAPREERWPTRVFRPPVYNPRVLKCPADLHGVAEHSYLLNAHLPKKGIKASSTHFGGPSGSEVVVMGEKKPWRSDYYLEGDEFLDRVELHAHGLRLGSNYLFFDMHVSGEPPAIREGAIDPWDLPLPESDPPAPTPPPTPALRAGHHVRP